MRVEAGGRESESVKGTLTTQTADSLTIAGTGGTQTTVPSLNISLIESSQGKSAVLGAGRGLVIGCGIGGGIGLVTGLVAARSAEGFDPLILPIAGIFGGVLAGGAVGAAVGAMVGAEQWKPIYYGPVRGRFGSARDRVTTMGLSIRF